MILWGKIHFAPLGKTMVETMVGRHLQGNQTIPGLLRWCRIWSIHSSMMSFGRMLNHEVGIQPMHIGVPKHLLHLLKKARVSCTLELGWQNEDKTGKFRFGHVSH